MKRTTYPLRLQQKDLFNLCHRYADVPGTLFLASGGNHPCARFSFLGLFAIDSFYLTLPSEDPWQAWQEALTFSYDDPYPEWGGFLSYEMGAYSDHEKKVDHHPSTMPDICFYRPACWIRYDRQSGESLLVVDEKSLSALSAADQQSISNLIEGGDIASSPEQPSSLSYALKSCSDTCDAYIDKITTIKELIADGTIYQVNLSQQLTIEGEGDPFLLYERLFDFNPTPFSAYLQTTSGAVVSLSPERLLSKQGSLLETRPIKGTAPRGASPEEDDRNKQQLEDSPKEKAELMMITDLMRNDLSRVSKHGSVRVPEIRRCEAYAHVFHMESVITSEADPQRSVFEIIRSCFPGGSITGCPKLSAMQVIHDIEQRPRGIYTGSIGYLCGNGDFDFNIAIRTLWCRGDKVDLQLGGAIVIDSDPKKEYEETIHKGASLLKILQLSQ